VVSRRRFAAAKSAFVILIAAMNVIGRKGRGQQKMFEAHKKKSLAIAKKNGERLEFFSRHRSQAELFAHEAPARHKKNYA
jgi:hypothetical protein